MRIIIDSNNPVIVEDREGKVLFEWKANQDLENMLENEFEFLLNKAIEGARKLGKKI